MMRLHEIVDYMRRAGTDAAIIIAIHGSADNGAHVGYRGHANRGHDGRRGRTDRGRRGWGRRKLIVIGNCEGRNECRRLIVGAAVRVVLVVFLLVLGRHGHRLRGRRRFEVLVDVDVVLFGVRLGRRSFGVFVGRIRHL